MVNSSKKKRTNDTSVLEKDSGKTCRYCVLINTLFCKKIPTTKVGRG